MNNVDDPKISLKITNGISLARIISMFWIFSVNYWPKIFRVFYGVEYQYAIETSKNFINVMRSSPWFIDRVMYVVTYAGWSGVVVFIFLTGFSLWFSILKSKIFKIGDYAIKRFNSIYVSYFISVMIAFLVGVLIKDMQPVENDLGVLIMGASRFVGGAYEYNPPMWFISILFLCYLFFPIIPIIYSKFRFPGILVFTLVCYGFYAYLGTVSFINLGGNLCRLVPFWVYLCFGVLIGHLVYKYKNIKVKVINLRITDILCLPIILVGTYLLYKYLYLEPASNLETPWAVKNVYPAAMAGVLVFFSIGYLLPSKFHKCLRWLSRGTLGVFLYHYIILPFLAPHIKPPLFTDHLSIALGGTYLVMLICLSVFQGILDKTIIKRSRALSCKDYKIIE